MFDLSGMRALVTGASGGLGAAIARTLHAQGAAVAISGTRRDALDRLRDRRRVEYDAQLERAEQSELDDLNRATTLNRQVSR
jgi:NAD(P)-dependent dehydrogenase (short-subunit alcohol dehydrogenase family)